MTGVQTCALPILNMKSGGFGRCGDVSQGNTLVWWSILIDYVSVTDPFAPIYVADDGFRRLPDSSQSVTVRTVFLPYVL